MKISTLLTLSPLLMPATLYASTVIYTDYHHPPSNLDASVTVIYLDAPEHLQAQLFGDLSPVPQQAERQIKAVLHSPKWQESEQQLASVYHDVIRAWELGVKKIPAVVFDNQDVVYGTADVAQAAALRAQALGEQ